MKLRVEDISAEPESRTFAHPAEDVNRRLEAAPVRDFSVVEPVCGDVTFLRVGAELCFHGELGTVIEGTCARCLEPFRRPLHQSFSFNLLPAAEVEENDDRDELSLDELTVSTYEGEEVDMGPLLSEQTILALPTRALCAENCKGLCSTCGANLNLGACGCPAPESGDSRLAILKTLKLTPAH